ncbi:RNase P modulator RnpM [Caloranaerobacter ferrireducens]|uniref:RNase P modulator RnpM n=1 Tax=Caloranaerobacter ferrireducens TaxID=1323370 RepID=UPI000B1A0A15|nr:YlxR family protein [Caloranaerobacter ferrireducens]
MMKKRKVPLRKCVGCNEQKPKKELVRIVKNKEGIVSIDLTGKANGRGAYICKNIDCLEKAVKGKKLNKALEIDIPQEIYIKLKEELTKNE